MISERPAEADDRAVPGHWEGDLILGLGSSAIGTLVERTTRFTMLLHLPPHAGPRRREPREERARARRARRRGGARRHHAHDHDPARAAATVADLGPGSGDERSTRSCGSTPALQVYFCDPHSPWQRGTNENTNGLLRQYFPKGTDLSAHSADDLAAVAATLNGRPRKTLGWRTPAEALDAVLRSAQAGVATTS